MRISFFSLRNNRKDSDFRFSPNENKMSERFVGDVLNSSWMALKKLSNVHELKAKFQRKMKEAQALW
jgi:hypothetical protein